MKDLTGQRFGRLVIVGPTEQRYGTYMVWECLCSCGVTIFRNTGLIKSGKLKSCGCLKAERDGSFNIKDITGKKVGRLTALQPTEHRVGGSVMWKCSCSCGGTHLVASGHLKSENVQSCGCLTKEYNDSRRKWDDKKLMKRALQGKRRAQKVQATPPWCDQSSIEAFYANCPPGLVVDHIIPLQGVLAVGLHVADNLQYLTPEENSRKRNNFTPYVEIACQRR